MFSKAYAGLFITDSLMGAKWLYNLAEFRLLSKIATLFRETQVRSPGDLYFYQM